MGDGGGMRRRRRDRDWSWGGDWLRDRSWLAAQEAARAEQKFSRDLINTWRVHVAKAVAPAESKAHRRGKLHTTWTEADVHQGKSITSRALKLDPDLKQRLGIWRCTAFCFPGGAFSDAGLRPGDSFDELEPGPFEPSRVRRAASMFKQCAAPGNHEIGGPKNHDLAVWPVIVRPCRGLSDC